MGAGSETATLSSFFRLFRIPSLRVVTTFVAVGTLGLFLVQIRLSMFLYDKFGLGLRAGFASTFPQIGTALELLSGGILADAGLAHQGQPVWVASLSFLLGVRCIFCLGAAATVWWTRLASIGFELLGFRDQESSDLCFRCSAGVCSRVRGECVESGGNGRVRFCTISEWGSRRRSGWTH
jgi:hypothetical protein